MQLCQRISVWIREQVKKAGAKGCVVGLSGGVDSSVVAVLCKQAFPNSTLGIILPCHSIPMDIRHARRIAKKYSIKSKCVDLTVPFDLLYESFEGKKYLPAKRSLPTANLKPRLRMLTLYYFANKLNYLVVGTGNKSELTMGYFTKYGDGGVDLLPLGGLLKSRVRELARELGLPEEIIVKAPSAGLWEGQTDEEEMGITYDILDKTIQALESGKVKSCDPKVLGKIRHQRQKTAHKLAMPPIFKP